MEGIHQIKTGTLTSFSEQQLVDCVKNIMGCCNGCNGGNYEPVYGGYAKDNAMFTESDWPYTGKDGTCSSKPSGKSPTTMKTTGYTAITSKNEDALKTALNTQPVSVAIQANQLAFQLYNGGVFNNSKCGSKLDHAVLLAGYGTENGQDYYLMKNSWGSSWGEGGYMKMAMNGDGPGMCGVQMQPVVPLM